MTESSSSFFSSDHDPSPRGRPRFFLWGFCSLLLGLVSFLALLGQMWWVCGGIGFLGATLIMIHFSRNEPPRTAQLIAGTGLCLSLVIVAYVPTQFYLRQQALCRQAALLGDGWLENILKGKAYKSLVALQDPGMRLAEDQLQTFYLQTVEGRREYKQFTDQKLVKSLLRLNGRARVQFYRTESFRPEGEPTIITSLFAISYLESPLKRKTFFVRLVFQYNRSKEHRGEWILLRYRGGVRPLGDFSA